MITAGAGREHHRRPYAVLAVLAAFAVGLAIGFLTGSASAAGPQRPQPARTRTVWVTPGPAGSFQPPDSAVPVVSGNG